MTTLRRSVAALLFPPGFPKLSAATWLREFFWIVGLSVVVLTCEHFRLFNHLESLGIDVVANIMASPQRSHDVTIILIQDEDFRSPQLFNGVRPAHKPELIQRIIDKIAMCHPQVIGIDLDFLDNTIRVPPSIPVVWARDREPSHGDPGEDEDEITPAKILGLDLSQPQPLSGLVPFPQDADGVVRRYYRRFPLACEAARVLKHDEMDSFAWAIVKEHCPRPTHYKAKQTEDELILNFVGDRYDFDRLNVGGMLKLADRPDWADNVLLYKRIVLLGSDFREAREDYETPRGKMSGVELIAQVVQSELADGGIREIAGYISFAIDLLVGLLLVYLNWRFPRFLGFVVSLLVIMTLALAVSYLTFRGLGYWFNFPLVMLAIFVHLQVENFRERGRHTVAHAAH